jgi:hypothetical protein
MSKHRNYASDSVKFLNQKTIERLLGDDHCYSASSGEYDENALKERLIELKTAKAERIGGRGYDEMLVEEKAQQTGCAPLQLFAAKPRYVRIDRPVEIKRAEIKFNIKKSYKFIIRY